MADFFFVLNFSSITLAILIPFLQSLQIFDGWSSKRLESYNWIEELSKQGNCRSSCVLFEFFACLLNNLGFFSNFFSISSVGAVLKWIFRQGWIQVETAVSHCCHKPIDFPSFHCLIFHIWNGEGCVLFGISHLLHRLFWIYFSRASKALLTDPPRG